MFDLSFIKNQFQKWNKKTEINIGNNKLYKVIGCGDIAFKILKFEPQQELGGKGTWVQVFWAYEDIEPGSEAFQVIKKMQSQM